MAKCLYNDIPLPVLPNEVLAQPNIFIGNTDDVAVAIGFSGAPQTWKTAGIQFVGSKEEANKIRAKITSDGTGWEIVEIVNNTTFSYPLAEVSWSNFDIYNSDGTLHLAASEPIPVGTAPTIEPLSMWLGWKAGNWVARQRGKKKQPVAFLYNGVRLPELPEWDKTVYPYAVILSSQSTYANLIVSTVPLYYTPVKSGFSTTHRLGAKADGSMLAFVYDSTNDDEVKRTSFVRDPDRDVEGFTAKENVKTLTLTSPKWANYDLLYYADDTVCVTASEPVPVYD